MEEFRIDDRVIIVGKNRVGTIAFIGNTQFSDGLWLGVILDEPVGRNSGSYDGIRYFKCNKNRGVFTRPCQVKKVSSKPQESEDQKMNSRKDYPNYLRNDSSSKPKGKNDSSAKKSTPLKKAREGKTLKSTSIPVFVSEGDVKLVDNNVEIKSKSINQTSKHLTEKHSQQKQEETDYPRRVDKLKDMISKTSKELNEVKDYVLILDRKLIAIKDSLREETSPKISLEN